MSSPTLNRVNIKLRDEDRDAIQAIRDTLQAPYHGPLGACAILRVALHDFRGRLASGAASVASVAVTAQRIGASR